MSPRSAGPPGRSANIFINYRREDSAGHAGRLFDGLNSHFPGRLFMDVDTIAPGVDFIDAIQQAVGACEVLIVVIGREWLNLKNAAGIRRLDDCNDFVRLEIETALARNIRIIPVLVQDTPMPRPEELPPSLARLARRNAIELSDVRWAYDVNRLAQTIQGVLGQEASLPAPEDPPGRQPPPPALAGRTAGPRTALFLLAATVLVSAIVLASAAWRSRRDSAPPVPSTAGNPASPARSPASEPPPTTNALGSLAVSQAAAIPSSLQTEPVQPPRSAPIPRRQEMPQPASPPPPARAPAPAEPEPAVEPQQKTWQAPAEPASLQETPAATEPPLGELSQLGSELMAAGERLGELYADFLERKEDAGSELTASDEKLQEELEIFAEEAERFNKRLNGGIFLRTRDRLLKTDPWAEAVRRFSGLAAAGGRVDRLMAEVQPSPEVRQEWQEAHRRWERVSQILRGR